MRYLLLLVSLATLTAVGWATATDVGFYAGEAAPYLEAQTVGMAPLAPLASWLDATVTGGGNADAVRVALGKQSVRFTVGANRAEYRNGEQSLAVTLPAEAVLRDEQVYVPLRGLIDGLHLASDWDARWLQLTLYHPTHRLGLVVALADPALPVPQVVRGRHIISSLTAPSQMFPLFELCHGALKQHSGHPLSNRTTAVKCYNLTRYLGGGRWQAKHNTYSITPHLSVGTAVCINGDWNAMPRTPQQEYPADPRNQARVHALLAAEKVDTLPVKIDQAYRIDLNGDGHDVILLSGTYITGYNEYHLPVGAYYSFAGIWDAVAEGEKPLTLAWQYFPSRDYIYSRFSIGGILDADGDGRMEVMLNDDSSWTGRSIHARTADGVKQIASASWGE